MITSTDGDADDDQRPEEARVADALGAALVAEVGAHRQQHDELGELGRLDLDRPDVDRQQRVAGDAADDGEHEEHGDRRHVQGPGAVLPPLVVDGHHDDHDERGDDGEDHLAGDERVGVGGADARRREDDEAAGDGRAPAAPSAAPSRCSGSGRPGSSGCCRARSPACAAAWRGPSSRRQSGGRTGTSERAMHAVSTSRSAGAGLDSRRVERLGDLDRVEQRSCPTGRGTCT